LFSLEVPDRGYERRDDRGTRGALGSKEFLGSNLGESCDIKSGEVQHIPTRYIYTEGYRAGSCAWTRLGIRMYRSVRTKITKKGII